MGHTDSELQQAVLREIAEEGRVEQTDVGVEVDAGVVTLTGTVDSWIKRTAAQAAAHRVAGVLDVANDIAVKLPGSAGKTDTELAHEVRRALERDAFVPHAQIVSTIAQGCVTLEGEVDDWSQRDAADKALSHLGHIRAVVNRIHVKPKPAESDLREAIRAALRRHAEREAAQITVEVRDGWITLGGKVRSYAEKQVVLEAAQRTAGAVTVDDRIDIEWSAR